MKLTEGKANSLLLTFGLLAFGCAVVTRQYCTRYMPESPSPDVGRTIAREANYGKTVYLTASESHYVDLAYVAAATFGAIAFAVVLLRSWQMFREGMREKA